ncbi:MAG: DUF4159 domain-containing protein [Candidatus Latescibacteria bacterium]|nr:DUF4159 domain-containing protein [Candidatus Latescibacterota bacterium]
MTTSSRFACPTSALDLDALLHRLRRAFGLSLLLALGLHLGMAAIDPFEQTTEKTVRPMTTKFIKREPRLTKPMELRKVPQPKRQMIRREVRLAAARMDQVKATSAFDTRGLIASHGGGVSAISLPRQLGNVTSSGMALEPALAVGQLAETRTVENRIDMALEMLDVNSMDTGRYRAMVIQDSKDRQSLKGFVKFAQVMSASAVSAGTVGWGAVNVKEVDALRDAVNEYTGLHADFIGSITFDDERLLEVPIIIPQGAPNESEMAQLSKYLLAGGFVFGGIWGEALEKYGHLVNGRDFWNERLPENHPVFSSFFDLKGGIPSGYPPSMGQGKFGVATWNYLTGYFVKGRLAGVSPAGGGWGWQNQLYGGDSTRQLQMAVNIIIYALTQEGSMTQRLMQMVN